MRVMSVIVSAAIAWSVCACAQQTPQPGSVMLHAHVLHDKTSVLVLAHQARPLQSALAAIAEEYGWVIDFEDPPYRSRYDLVDNTDPQWHANHPSEEGVTRIAGEAFESEFQEGLDIGTPSGEERVLNKIVSDYNTSGNPGKFAVHREGRGRYAVIGKFIKDESGRDRHVSAILDTPVSIATQRLSAMQAVALILDVLSVRTGQRVALMDFPVNAYNAAEVTVGGADETARHLLLQTLDQTDTALRWDLLFDNDSNTYFLTVSVRPIKD